MSPEGDPTVSPTTDAAVASEPIAAVEAVTAQPPTEESGAPARAEQNTVVNDLFRSAARQPTSKPVESEPAGESTPSGDVKPAERARGADGRFVSNPAEPEQPNLGRRGAAEEIARLQRENERLSGRLKDYETTADAQVAVDDEAQARADAERYLRLRDLPENHPELTDNDYEGWKWLEEQRQLRAGYPKASKAMQAQLAAEVATETARLRAGHQATLNTIAEQMGRVGARFGVDVAELQRLGDFEQIANAITAPLLAEIADLRREQQQHRYAGNGGLGSARAPVGAGRSPGSPPPNMNDVFRSFANGRG